MVICGSGSLTSSREEGIVVTNGNLTITGDAELDLTGNVRDTSIHVRYGTLTINGDADVKAKTISTNNADHQADVTVDAEISRNAKVSAEKLAIAGKLTMKGSSVVNVNGVGISGNQGIDILENAEVNVTSSSVALNAFYGPINIDSTKKVTAVTTSAAIAAGVSQATEPTNVTIKSEVEVSGSVGVAANGTNSNVVIDGGTVTANSSFIGLYTQANTAPGIVDIKNGAIVNVIGSGKAAPGIATYNQNQRPINIEKSTVSVSNCGFGLSGSAITVKDSDVTVASTTYAFLKTPTLDYSTPVTISAGKGADSAVEIPVDSITSADYQNKYVKIVPNAQLNITYKLSEDDTAPNIYKCFADTEIAIASAPTKDSYVFTGWKDDGGTTYYVGQTITPTGDMTFTAQWQAVDEWIKDPDNTENPGKLDVDVDVKVDVDVAVNVGVTANVTGMDTLGNDIRDMLKNVVTNDASVSDTIGKANELHALLNKGASNIDADLTVSAVLQSTPNEDELKTLIGKAFTSGEQPQKWELSVTLNTVAKDASNVEIGRVESAPIKRTNAPIVFTLTTGQDLTGKDVRVLHVLDSNGSTKVANSTVKDAANGVVEVTASSFSPYIILVKDRPSSGHHSSGGSSVSSYPVSVTAPTHGKLTADKSNAAKGATVTLTVASDQGFELSRLTVTDKDGKEIVLTDKGNGKYTFTMPASKVTVSAEFAEIQTASTFADVPADAYYAKAVEWAVKNGITNGKANGLFGSNDPCTRGQIVTFLWRSQKSPAADSANPFADVSADAYYADAVLWAVKESVTAGTTSTAFSPDNSCIRAQIVTFLWRLYADK